MMIRLHPTYLLQRIHCHLLAPEVRQWYVSMGRSLICAQRQIVAWRGPCYWCRAKLSQKHVEASGIYAWCPDHCSYNARWSTFCRTERRIHRMSAFCKGHEHRFVHHLTTHLAQIQIVHHWWSSGRKARCCCRSRQCTLAASGQERTPVHIAPVNITTIFRIKI